MPYQNIEATLSVEDLKEITAAIATIQTKMPFLISLSAEERRRLYKMGDKRLAFVQNSLNAAQNNQGILPNSFDFNGYVLDCELAKNLNEVMMSLNQVSEQVDDTLVAVGSEAMSSSLTVYDYVKTAAKKTPGLKNISDQLGTLFKAIKTKPLAKP
jgi:arginine deiminase